MRFVCHACFVLFVSVVWLSGCTSSTEPHKQPPARLEAVTPTELTGIVGTLTPSVPAVRALDEDGNPISGVAVSFTTSQGDSVGQSTVTTDNSGVASVGRWRLGAATGTHTVSAQSAGFSVVFKATAKAGPVAFVSVLEGDGQIVTAGSTAPLPLRAIVTDSFRNPVGAAVVTAFVAKGGGKIEAESALTGPDGVALLGSWKLGTDPGTQEVWAQSGAAYAVFTAVACEASACPEILFMRSGNIYRYGGSGITQLTFDGRSYEPAWSPDGRRIAYVRTTGSAGRDIYVMDADGSNPSQKTSGIQLMYPAWSPDGKKLIMAGGAFACVYECAIYLLDLNGANAKVDNVAPMGSDPAWSPDGKKIVYVSLSGDDGYHALYVMNSDASEISELTPRDEGALFGPTWSPDGTRIAVSKCLRAVCDIYTLSPSSPALTKVTNVGNAFDPSWSPDGKLIAFTRTTYNGSLPSYSIDYVPAAGGETIHLLSNASSPAWHP